jgi:hypothetical protein
MNAIFTDRDVVFDHEFVGKWSDPESSETWEFGPANGNEYRLIHTDDHGKTGTFTARLANLRGKMFLDIVPIRGEKDATEFYDDHFFETHSFVLIEKKNNAVLVSYLEPKWLKEHLAAKPQAVKHLVLDDEILLTDSTENLQKFLSGIVDVKGAFSEPSEVKRVSTGK